MRNIKETASIGDDKYNKCEISVQTQFEKGNNLLELRYIRLRGERYER